MTSDPFHEFAQEVEARLRRIGPRGILQVRAMQGRDHGFLLEPGRPLEHYAKAQQVFEDVARKAGHQIVVTGITNLDKSGEEPKFGGVGWNPIGKGGLKMQAEVKTTSRPPHSFEIRLKLV